MADLHPAPDCVSDEEYDAVNDETFGGDEDEGWEWGEETSDDVTANKSHLPHDHSSGNQSGIRPMHSSDLMTSMTSIPNVSGIRRLSELEESFSAIGLQQPPDDFPDDPAIMKMSKSSHLIEPNSSILTKGASSPISDPFESFSGENRLLMSSSVWADQSLFSTGSNSSPLVSSGSPVPPAPPSDPWKKDPPPKNHVTNQQETRGESLTMSVKPQAAGEPVHVIKPMSLEELEASFLSESPAPKPKQQQENETPKTAFPVNPLINPAPGLRPPLMPPGQAMPRPLVPFGPDGRPLLLPSQLSQRLVHPMHAMARMPMPIPHQIAVRHPLIPPNALSGRVNMIQHPHIQQNFLLLQQAQYRPPPQFFEQQQRMFNMQMQQRFPLNRTHPSNNGVLPHHQPGPNFRPQPYDKYAGIMDQREREWLVRIQKLQLESLVTDPYVEDYYAMCYNSKKLAEAKTKNAQAAPTLILVESRKNRSSSSSSKKSGNIKARDYVPLQFENSLGKIQVSSIQYPRKLLDLISKEDKKEEQGTSSSSSSSGGEPKPLARKELTQFRKILLEIERLYLILLQIDQKDKRMAALPGTARRRQSHELDRENLCKQLFDGLTESFDQPAVSGSGDTSTGDRRLNMRIASVRKGCALLFRSLQLLQDVHQREVIVNGLLDEEAFHVVVNQTEKDKELYSMDYLKILVDAMKSINPALRDEDFGQVIASD